MIINITKKDVELDAVLFKSIEKKLLCLSKFVKRYEKLSELCMFVEIARTTKHHKKGDIFYVEAMIELPHILIRANATGGDVKSTTTQVEKMLQKQLVKHKDKESHDRKLRHAKR